MATLSKRNNNVIAFPASHVDRNAEDGFVQQARGTGGLSDNTLRVFFQVMARCIDAKKNGDRNPARYLSQEKIDHVARLKQLYDETIEAPQYV